MVFGRDNIDFVKVSFVVPCDNDVALFGEIIRDSGFGLLADFGSVFLSGGGRFEIREGLAGFERFTMLGCETAFIDGGDMSFGAIADVLVKTVVGILGGEVFHILITSDFGDDGSGGDFADESVGFNAGGDVRSEGSVL